VHPLHHALAQVETDHRITGVHQLHRQGQSDVAEPHDPEAGRAVARLGEQRVGGGDRGGGAAHSVTGAPPPASERDAASRTRTTRTPSAAPVRGGSVPRATRTKWLSSAASGSTLAMLGMKMSPSRIVRASPYEAYSGGRSTPLSSTRSFSRACISSNTTLFLDPTTASLRTLCRSCPESCTRASTPPWTSLGTNA